MLIRSGAKLLHSSNPHAASLRSFGGRRWKAAQRLAVFGRN